MFDQVRYQRRGLDAAHPVADALSAQSTQRSPHAFRSYGLTGMGQAVQPTRPRPVKGMGERLRRRANLIAAQAQRHHPPIPPGQRHVDGGVAGVAGVNAVFEAQVAGDVQHPGHVHPKLSRRLVAPGLQTGDQVIRLKALVLPEVRKGCKRDLAVSDVLSRHFPAEIVDNQSEIVGRAQQAGNGEVDVDEMTERGEAIPRPQPRYIIGRQWHIVPLRQGQQGFGQDAALQMDVQLDLRQGRRKGMQPLPLIGRGDHAPTRFSPLVSRGQLSELPYPPHPLTRYPLLASRLSPLLCHFFSSRTYGLPSAAGPPARLRRPSYQVMMTSTTMVKM